MDSWKDKRPSSAAYHLAQSSESGPDITIEPPTPLTSLSNAFSGFQWRQPAREEGRVRVEDVTPRSARRLKLLIALSATCLALFLLAPHSNSIHSAALRASTYSWNRSRPPTRVGKRDSHSFYHGRGCNSTELLRDLALARIAPNGASRYRLESSPEATLNLSRFDFSYELPNCPDPHVFTPQETCDLLGSFGGIFLRGDSLVRHLSQALMFLLTNSLDIVSDHQDDCFGEGLFSHGRQCRLTSYFDLETRGSVCSKKPYIKYEQVWRFITVAYKRALKYPVDDYPLLENPTGNLTSFLDSLPLSRQSLSPIIILGAGIHFDFRVEDALDYHINPYLANTSSLTPRPISLWSAYSAPSTRKPKKFAAKQGSEAVKKYNGEVQDALTKVSPGEVAFGAMRSMDWFAATDGAYSYDGTHSSYIVNMEKAMMLLNLLDTIWGEVVEAGGLVP